MKDMAQHIVTRKLKQLTVKDVLKYCEKYGIQITKQEADQIIKELKHNNFNPLNANERITMLKKLAAITSPDTAKKVNRILYQIAEEYGVSHLLK
ncbi:Protein of unknown function [Thalassobacillus cyri]|uniref:DUF2624 domain-containing protein n=1 Tax=Thalassobacillus cyri TaxID=571932 RepID=A0A1H4FJS8_9BACI|nr:DUF2624 family protein [Thalassobacillus cyri]SEA97008.1 Protein of unknown function [Thalassobacillus cyri]